MRSNPEPTAVPDYVAALIQSSAQITMIVEQMERFSRRRKQGGRRPSVAILSELIEGVLTDPSLELDLHGIERGREILIAVSDAIADNLFFVDPDAFGSDAA